MPAPSVCAVRVPFYYAAPSADGAAQPDAAVLITYITLEVISFDERFFWLHLSESPAEQHVPRLGSCSVAVALAMCGSEAPPSVSSSQLMEFEAARPQDMSAGTNTSVQAVFATGLSQRLVRGVAKRFKKQVTVYVNCAIEGERCLALLGTESGGGLGMTFDFGGLAYREAFAVLAKQLESHASSLSETASV